MRKIFILLVAINFATSQPAYQSLAVIDGDLTNMNTNLMTAQQNLRDHLLNYSLTAQFCSSNLKSLNITSLTSALDDMSNSMNQLRTVDEFEHYKNISTCGDVRVEYSQVYLQYAVNMKNLGGFLSTNERMVFGVINKYRETVQFYSDFMVLLGSSAARLAYYNALLTVFKKSYCQCLNQVTFVNVNSTLENNLKVVEKKLIGFQSKMISSAAFALRSINSAVNSTSSTLKVNFQALQAILTSILTTSDYTTIKTPNVTTCDEFWVQFHYILFKHRQYWNILISTSQNSSKIIVNRVQINATLLSNPSTSTILRDSMNLTMRLENVYEEYKSQLVYSIWKTARMIYMLATDSFCTCEIDGITTVSSTSTTTKLTKKPRTTTKVLTTTSTSSTSSKPTTSTTVKTTTSTTTPTTSSTTQTTTTSVAPCAFNRTLPSGACMKYNDELRSCNGCYSAAWQSDQNFCLYAKDVAYFSTDTYNSRATTACMQTDGNFVIKGWWSFETGTSGNNGAVAVMREDGHFSIELGGKILWQTRTVVCSG